MVFTHEFQQIYLPTWCGWAQTIFLPQCCFTSTETIRTITDRKPRTSTWAFTQLLSPDKPIHFRSGISVDGHLSSSCGCVHTHTMHNGVLADIPVYNSQVCLNIMFQAQYNYVICLLLCLNKQTILGANTCIDVYLLKTTTLPLILKSCLNFPLVHPPPSPHCGRTFKLGTWLQYIRSRKW